MSVTFNALIFLRFNIFIIISNFFLAFGSHRRYIQVKTNRQEKRQDNFKIMIEKVRKKNDNKILKA